MNTRKKNKFNKILAAILLLLPVIVLGMYFGRPNAVIDPSLYTLRTPFNVNYLGFDVHDGVTNEFISSVEPGQQFVDPTHTYPKVDVFKSGAFFVDPAGNYVETCPEAYLEPYGVLAIDGKIFYAHELRYGFDFGVRSTGNMPLIQSYSSDVSPLWGFTSGTHTFQLDEPDGPYGYDWSSRGVLTGYVASTGFDAAPVFASGATITSMLEPIDIRVGSNPQNAVHTYDTAIQTLQTKYGNSKVSVYPKLSLEAMPSFFSQSFDFDSVLDGDNVTFTVSPGNANIGISNVDKSWIHDQKGLIPNTLQEDLQDRGIQTTIPATGNVVPRENDYEYDNYNDDSAFPTTSETLHGSIEYLGPSPDEVITGFADPFGSVAVNTSIPDYEFIFDQDAKTLINNYPESVELTMGNTIQPLTTVKVANFRISWEIGFVNVITGTKSYFRDSDDVKIPYGIVIENVYTVQRAIVSVIVLTENEITATGPTGQPVDISQLTDFQLNQIIKDPTRDIFERDANMWEIDWDRIGSSVAFIAFIIILVVVVITIIGAWVFFKFIKGGRGGGGGGSSGPSSYSFKWGDLRWGFKKGGKKS